MARLPRTVFFHYKTWEKLVKRGKAKTARGRAFLSPQRKRKTPSKARLKLSTKTVSRYHAGIDVTGSCCKGETDCHASDVGHWLAMTAVGAGCGFARGDASLKSLRAGG